MAGNFLGMDFASEHDTPMGVAIKLKGRSDLMAGQLRDLAGDAASLGADIMRMEAPRASGGLLGRIDSDDPVWHPGGYGGGGYWEASAGVIDIGPEGEYPLFVFEGTGLKAGRGVIHPNFGNVFPLTGLVNAATGKMLYRQWQTGQEPQTGWVENAQRAADELVSQRLDSIAAE